MCHRAGNLLDTFEARISCHHNQVRVQTQVGENWSLMGGYTSPIRSFCSTTVVISDVAIIPELVTYS